MKSRKSGFTLVELIVVITILAILGTIGFLAFQGYSINSRDSVRTSDLGSMKTSLELFKTKTGIYPTPTNGVEVTYSGALVWTQGTMGEETIRQLGNLNKVPKDPLLDLEYTYSITNAKTEYELAGVYEGLLTQNNNKNGIINKSYAQNTTKGETRIIGTYNGGLFHLINVQTGGINNVLFTPSLINGYRTLSDLEEIISKNEIVLNGSSKLPPSYKNNSKFSDEKLELNLGENNGGSLVVWTGSIGELKRNTSSGLELRKTFIGNIQNVVLGSLLESSYGKLMSLNLTNNETTTNSTDETELDTSESDYFYSTDDESLMVYDTKLLVTNLLDGSLNTQGPNIKVPSDVINGGGGIWNGGGGTNTGKIIIPPVIIPDPILIDSCSTNLTQGEADELNGLINKTKTINEWCKTTSLSLINKNLSNIPTGVLKLLNLTKLNLRNNNITTVPSSILNLTKLTNLVLGKNQITTLPTEVGNLTNLTYLGLNSNQLTSLPNSIGNLINLKGLGLGRNQLTILPTEIGNLTNLIKLGLHTNNLTTLPTEIGNLTNLTHLILGNNNLTSLPTSIGNLTNLKYLGLHTNNLITLPTEIGNLTNLRNLILGGNSIISLPTSIGNLINLDKLGLWSNGLTSLPLEMGNLKNLTRLNLPNNPSLGNLGTYFTTGINKSRKDTKGTGNQCVEITSTKVGKISINTNANCSGAMANSCDTQPIYTNATFTTGNPTSANQAWQSINNANPCYWTCGQNKVLLGNDCVSESCSGTTPDGTSKLSNATSTAGGTWHYNTTPGVCTYECNTSYHTEDSGVTCVENTRSCSITSWDSCTVTSCDSNYSISGNSCAFNSCDTQPSYTNASFTTGSPTSPSTTWQNTTSGNPCYYSCTGGYTGSDCSIAPNPYGSCTSAGQILTASNTYPGVATAGQQPAHPACNTADIIVSAGSGSGYTLSACNIGSSIAGTTASSYGLYFQWGRNKGFAYGDTSQQSTKISGNIGLNSGIDTYLFVSSFTAPSPHSWANTDITNNWGDTSDSPLGTNISARQGPCASGYHVPSQPEWSGIITTGGWGTNGTNMQTALKMPFAGSRDRASNNIEGNLTTGSYWSSSPAGPQGYVLNFNSFNSGIFIDNSYFERSFGTPIRCFKN